MVTVLDSEDIRKRYKPHKIKIFFAGESIPAGGNFFYKGDSLTDHTKLAFEKAFGRSFDDYEEFLNFFKQMDCYLDDMSLIPVNHMEPQEREKTLKACINSFSRKLDSYSPEIIIIIMKKIKRHVLEAVGRSNLDNVCIHTLTYPCYSMKNRTRYVDDLVKILKHLT
jgi:hypothetical protein